MRLEKDIMGEDLKYKTRIINSAIKARFMSCLTRIYGNNICARF